MNVLTHHPNYSRFYALNEQKSHTPYRLATCTHYYKLGTAQFAINAGAAANRAYHEETGLPIYTKLP